MMTPLRRYHPTKEWEVVPHAMVSPAPDGSVAYFQDSLSPSVRKIVALFDDSIGRALCRYLVASITGRGFQITDGPYLQVLEEDGLVPHGWVMLRAVAWCDEFDLLVPEEENKP